MGIPDFLKVEAGILVSADTDLLPDVGSPGDLLVADRDLKFKHDSTINLVISFKQVLELLPKPTEGKTTTY